MNFKLGYRNLMRNKRRTIATGIAITMGFSGFVLATGYVVRIEKYLRVTSIYLRHAGHLSIYKKGAFERNFSKPERDSLSGQEVDQIKSIVLQDKNVENTGRFLKGTGLVSNGCMSFSFYGVGIDPETDHYLRNHPLVKKVLPELGPIKRGKTLYEMKDHPDTVNMSEGLAYLLGKKQIHFDSVYKPAAQSNNINSPKCDPEDTNIQLVGGTYQGGFSAADGTLTGLFATGNAELEEVLLTTSVTQLQKLYETDHVTYMTVYLKDDSSIAKKADTLQKLLRREGLDVDVFPWNIRQISPNYTGFVGFLKMLCSFIYSVLAIVVGISIVNTSTLSIIERTREIGTLRAIGFKTKHIVSIFMHETLILVFFCMISSAVISTFLITAINSANIRFSPPGVAGTIQFLLELTPLSVFIISAGLITVAIASTYIGIRKKVKQNIIESL